MQLNNCVCCRSWPLIFGDEFLERPISTCAFFRFDAQVSAEGGTGRLCIADRFMKAIVVI